MPLELWLSSIYKKQNWSDLMVCLLKKSMAFYRKRYERDILANESKSDMWSLLPDYYSICSVLTWKSITVSLSHWQRMLIGLARDLRGIAFALNTKTSYTMLFDWMYPYYTVTIPALCTEGCQAPGFHVIVWHSREEETKLNELMCDQLKITAQWQRTDNWAHHLETQLREATFLVPLKYWQLKNHIPKWLFMWGLREFLG